MGAQTLPQVASLAELSELWRMMEGLIMGGEGHRGGRQGWRGRCGAIPYGPPWPRALLCEVLSLHCRARAWEQDLPSPGLPWGGLGWAGLGCQGPCWELQEGLQEGVDGWQVAGVGSCSWVGRVWWGSPVGKVGGWARAVPLAGSQDSRSESEQWGGA
jgi:hypothetical protein